MALDKDGNVWSWGDNSFGQLGNGNFDYNYSGAPVRVLKPGDVPLTNIVSIDAGFEHSLAIDRDDNVWVWGRNDEGQLGLGSDYFPESQKYAIQMP